MISPERLNEGLDAARAAVSRREDALAAVHAAALVALADDVARRLRAMPLVASAWDGQEPEALVAQLRRQAGPEWATRAHKRASKLLGAASRQVMKEIGKPIGVRFDLTNPLLERVFQSLTNPGHFEEGAWEAVRASLQESHDAGLSIPEAAAAMRTEAGISSSVRGRIIARTELVAMVNAGGLAAARITKAEGGFTAPRGVTVREFEGEVGNSQHLTRIEEGKVSPSVLANLDGLKGEVPGAHRNMSGEQWAAFVEDVRKNGVRETIFVTVDYGQPARISEGNHRRDAAVEAGLDEVPVEIRYFGNAKSILPPGPAVALFKQWLATDDDRTRPTHREAAGQVRPIDDTFTVGGYDLDHPGDPTAPPAERVNCRCTALFVDDPAGFTGDQGRSSLLG